MSSTERAPEPTMEEILASIRRIITDDEAGQGKAAKPAQKAQSEDESLEGEADNQIIDDIARVLSGGGGGGAVPANENEEEEILDLTAELGGLEIVEDDDEPVFETDEEVVEVLELEEIVEAAPEEESPDTVEETDEAPVEEPEPEPEPEAAAPEPPQAPEPEPQPEAPKLSASEEAASALERAIAALRAGQVPTSTTPQAEPFQFNTAPQPEAMTAPAFEPLPMAEPMSELEPAEETHPEPESYFEPQGEADFDAEPEAAPVLEPMDESEPEPELVMAEIEETVEFTASEPEPEPEQEPFWPAPASEEQPSEPEQVYEPEPERVAAQMNGGAHHDVAGKTLEDSIKDMLRPMLRQWLDENMPRIVREMDPEALRRDLD